MNTQIQPGQGRAALGLASVQSATDLDAEVRV